MPIETIRSRDGLGAVVDAWRRDGLSVGMVPTMGALHAGHMALVTAAKKNCQRVVASVFVNPTQFGPNDDFAAYPRNEDADRAMLEQAGVDVLYAPDIDEMYPDGTESELRAGPAARRWEGERRPGHFDGVVTVVERLLAHAKPDRAFFGEKDYQQLQVISEMVRERNLGVEITGVATVREDDGLALSSRNAYLSPAERKTAPTLNRVLNEVARGFVNGESASVLQARAVSSLEQAGFSPVDYVAVVDANTLEPLETFSSDTSAHRPARVIAAARLGRARLIDNIAVVA